VHYHRPEMRGTLLQASQVVLERSMSHGLDHWITGGLSALSLGSTAPVVSIAHTQKEVRQGALQKSITTHFFLKWADKEEANRPKPMIM
jgi:hypothetical protein